MECHPLRAFPAGRGGLSSALALTDLVGTEHFAFKSQLLPLAEPFQILFGR